MKPKRPPSFTLHHFATENRGRVDDCGASMSSLPAAALARTIKVDAAGLADLLEAIATRPLRDRNTEDVLDVVADIVTHCDLLTQRLGFQLDDRLRRRWNRISERAGSSRRLEMADK